MSVVAETVSEPMEFQVPTVSSSSDVESEKKIPPTPEKCASNQLSFPKIAQPVTVPGHLNKSLPLSPMYSPLNEVSYMNQCFDDVKYIAEGSFGIVFEVRSKDDGKLYAVKQFKTRFTGTRQRNLRLGEVHRYASIPQSRFCVELIRAWEEDAYLFVQMELCPYTLKQFIRRKGVSEELLWKILLDLLLAVRHLHSNQYVHLDIKPDNILVSPDETFKLADFGLMLDLSGGPVQDAEEGDARYLAPEVLRGVFTKAADIFSLGISMFEIGSSAPLPSHGDYWQVLRHGNLPEDHFKEKSKEYVDVIHSMMAPLPGQRPPADKLLKHNRLAGMHRKRCVNQFLSEMASTMKSICSFGKVMAVNYGRSVFKPLVSRMCLMAWRGNSRVARRGPPNMKKLRRRLQSAPCMSRLAGIFGFGGPNVSVEVEEEFGLGTPRIPVQMNEEEAKLFRDRLAHCKKRLNFDDDEGHEDCEPTSTTGDTGSNDGAMINSNPPKRRSYLKHLLCLFP